MINSTTGEVTSINVTVAYIPAGNHMRLFIGYPYFGNCTLEHDPSISVESIALWLSTKLIWLLMGVTMIIGVVLAIVKVRKKTVNIVSMR